MFQVNSKSKKQKIDLNLNSILFNAGSASISSLKHLSALVLSIGLTACYVVPVHQQPQQQTQIAPAMVQVVPVRPPSYSARLYPANSQAAAIGLTSGKITNPERGHGEFSFVTSKGEVFSGEATRMPNSQKGTANATGNLGSFVKCEYMMNSVTLGSGSCLFSNGAQFDLHVSLEN